MKNNSIKSFEQYFKQNIISSNGENKFVIILGSGIHKHASNDNINVLSDWSTLLQTVDKKINLTGDHVLDFETIVCRRVTQMKDKAAHDIENEILKEITNKLKNINISKWKGQYPIGIFNNQYVGDVINLNFDTKVEEIFADKQKLRNQYSDHSNNSTKSPLMNTLYHEVNGIRFWHPHGSVNKPNSILLGLRRYSHSSKEVESLRKRYKAKTRVSEKLNVQKTNWYDVLTISPVIICGASMSTAEWDIWLAIVNRMRNYAKNPEAQMPIFIMTGGKPFGDCTAKGGQHYFIPISQGDTDFKEEWKLLEKLFSASSPNQ